MEVLKLLNDFPYDDFLGRSVTWKLQYDFLQLLQENEVIEYCLTETHVKTVIRE